MHVASRGDKVESPRSDSPKPEEQLPADKERPTKLRPRRPIKGLGELDAR